MGIKVAFDFAQRGVHHGLEAAHALLREEGVEGCAATAVQVMVLRAQGGIRGREAVQFGFVFVAPVAADCARVEEIEEVGVVDVEDVGADADDWACGGC